MGSFIMSRVNLHVLFGLLLLVNAFTPTESYLLHTKNSPIQARGRGIRCVRACMRRTMLSEPICDTEGNVWTKNSSPTFECSRCVSGVQASHELKVDNKRCVPDV